MLPILLFFNLISFFLFSSSRVYLNWSIIKTNFCSYRPKKVKLLFLRYHVKEKILIRAGGKIYFCFSFNVHL